MDLPTKAKIWLILKTNMKMTFSKTDRKIPMRRLPNKIFGVWEFLHPKFVKKHFRGREPQESTILGLFINRWSKFLPIGNKRVFLRPRFFQKIEEMGKVASTAERVTQRLSQTVLGLSK